MIYFQAKGFNGRNVELSLSGGSAGIGVWVDGTLVGTTTQEDTQQIMQWLVNHDRLDLDAIMEAKRIHDGDDDCRCTGGAFNVTRPSCPVHFNTE